MLCSIPGSRGEGSDLPGYLQTTEVTPNKSSTERSRYMHIDKQVTLSILVMLVARDTKTAEVEGLWFANRPKCLVPEHQDNSYNSLEAWSCSPIVVPSLYPHDIT